MAYIGGELASVWLCTMRSFGNVRNVSGYIVIMDMFVRRRRVNVLPRAVHRESTAARRATSDARATLFVLFFCLFICNFFKRCFFPAIPPFRSDCCFSFHFYAGSVRISSSPITLAQPVTRSPQHATPLLIRHSARRIPHRRPDTHSLREPVTRQRRHGQTYPCQRAHLLSRRGREA